MQKVVEYLKQILKFNDIVVLAVSGGADSMALLNIVLSLKQEYNLEIICAHVNHNQRVESENEKEMVESFCKKNNIIFEYTKFTTYDKGNFQEIARKKRYEFFEKILKKHDSHILMTAHHGDDLTETILMRIARGSTLKGYSGFSKYNNNEWYQLIRPLVYVTKDELLEYVKKNNIPYAVDQSNTTDHYTRNRYRHYILKELKKEDKDIHKKFLKFSEKIDEVADYINEVVEEKTRFLYIDNTLDIIKFNYEKPYMQKMILNSILSNIYNDDVKYLKDKHILMIIDIINSYRPNIEIVLPKKIRVLKRYDKLIFTNEETLQTKYSYPFEHKLELNGKIIEEIDDTNEDSNYICRLSIEDVRLPLFIRNRHDGDKMTIKGMEGTKKIKEIFIEEKIPKEERDTWPILVDSKDQILWLPGLKKSKYNKQKNENCDIILKYY